jgi:hypothetical protein
MDDLGFERGHLLPQDAMIMMLQPKQRGKRSPRMSKEAMDPKPSTDELIAFFAGPSMRRGEDAKLMASFPQAFDDIPATFLITADSVGRIEIGQDKNSHVTSRP